ncbi:MAG: type II/IV secretion system ATPase subunit, partial [Candidatus Thermoplasmatota archaeon]|nr:type II/IV secretion system ATPase subunit [Candidatus Thermoplasmatota archaeon]
NRKIDAVLEVMKKLRTSPPPEKILEDETSLRGYVEKKASSLLSSMDIDVGSISTLSRIVGQYTCGYGILEHLLRDDRVQDIYIDAPCSERPVYVSLGGSIQGNMRTNISLSGPEMDRIASILRYHSGRPFSETNPVLECDIRFYNARATAVAPPMSPEGISMALRKHSHDPWTLVRLIRSGTVTPQAAAFLSLAVDGRSTALIAGPRGAGKSSLLGALLFEVDTSQRMIIIEDTPELPLRSLNLCGYKVLGLNVGSSEASTADKALRTALRLGESVLVMGEVRGPETRTLYEAMSAGTAGSSVMGTFHADSASTVYKRAVEDMGVSPGSFSSTDLVVVTGLVQPKGSQARLRRVVQIAELVKDAEPGTFSDLFIYDSQTDRIRPTSNLGSSSLLGRIAGLWGLSRKDVLEEHSIRSSVLSEAIKLFDERQISRPETAARIATTFRQVKEKAIKEGWMGDRKRFLESWKFTSGEVWD